MQGKPLRWALGGLLLTLGMLLPGPAGAEVMQTADGMGGIVQHNQAAARTKAIQNALRQALEDAVGALLGTPATPDDQPSPASPDDQRLLETHLYARTTDFIRSYRVLWEYPDTFQRAYRVGVEAEVAADEVAQKLHSLGLIDAAGAGGGRVLVLTVEHHLERIQESGPGRHGGVVARGLHSQLQAYGLQPVLLETGLLWDGSLNSALSMARGAGADLVLIAQSRVQHVGRGVVGMSLQAVQATIRVQALQVATGREVAVQQEEATIIHADAVVGGMQALQKAVTEVAERVLAPLQKSQTSFRGASRYGHRPR